MRIVASAERHKIGAPLVVVCVPRKCCDIVYACLEAAATFPWPTMMQGKPSWARTFHNRMACTQLLRQQDLTENANPCAQPKALHARAVSRKHAPQQPDARTL